MVTLGSHAIRVSHISTMSYLLFVALDAAVKSIDATSAFLGAACHSGGVNDESFSTWDFSTVEISLLLARRHRHLHL